MKNVNRKWFLAVITVIIVVAIVSFVLASMTKVDHVNRGPVWEAVERTLGSYKDTNPVKEDLIKRGLVKLEESGYIRVQEIEELVREKVYVIDKQGYLQFGPAYMPPKTP